MSHNNLKGKEKAPVRLASARWYIYDIDARELSRPAITCVAASLNAYGVHPSRKEAFLSVVKTQCTLIMQGCYPLHKSILEKLTEKKFVKYFKELSDELYKEAEAISSGNNDDYLELDVALDNLLEVYSTRIYNNFL